MPGLRPSIAALVVCLAGLAVPAAANPAPPPDFRNWKADADPPQIDPRTVTAAPPVREAPRRRTGPFRSCGSGMGTGLAAVGVAWGLMWVGNRFAGRVARGR